MFKTHSWRTASLVMALIVIVGLALPAFGDDWRPFRGHADETLIIPPLLGNVCGVSCSVTAVGAGQATHLGQFTRLACGTLQPDGSVEGTLEFTAANGDTLCADFKGEPPISGIVRVTYTFTGGTGRFSDVSGGAYGVGVITFPHIAVDFGGIIQY
jgi:hypothetical protein